MPNRRTDPTRSATSEMFRPAGQGRGNQLGAEGGKPGTDIGTTRSPAEDLEPASDGRPRQQRRRKQ